MDQHSKFTSLTDQPLESEPTTMDTTCENGHVRSSIPINLIEVPETARKVSPAVVAEIAASIRSDGLLQPIGLRPNPEAPGRYLLVYGRHRLQAVAALGETSIEAKVLDVDDEQAEMAMHAENLFREPLAEAERLAALAAWGERYQTKYPEVHGKRAGAEGKKRRSQVEDAGADSASEATGNSEQPPPTFTKMAAERLGVSQRVVQKDLRVAKALRPEDVQLLEERGVGKTDREKLAALDDEARGQAISLVASGLEAKQAIAMATLPSNATVEYVGHNESQPPTEAEMSDDQWLETFCGDVLARLKYTTAYRKDAILYRRIRDARQTFRNATKTALSQSKIQLVGPFQYAVANFVNIDHPSRWLPCGPCGGTGQSGDKSRCGFCRGHAYDIKNGGCTRKSS